MFKNYLLISWRNMFRHFSISFMNLIGLSAGLVCALLILLWVSDELSFDRFHANAGRIYRVEEDQHYSNGIFHVTVVPWPSGPVWKENIPEIEQSCRITSAGSFLFKRNDRSFYEEKVSAADSDFFRIFSFELLRGDPKTVLKKPGSIVITDEMAAKYFGNEDPLGKTLQANNNEIFEVTGVMKKSPGNSSVEQDFLIPFDYMKNSQWYSESWNNNSIFTYVLLKDKIDPVPLNDKITRIVKEHNPDNTTDFLLFPLTRLHLYGYWGYGHKPGAILHVWIFASIALLVLIIACINFMNLSTARSASRAKEIGLRKVNGAYRKNLIGQFYGESLFMSLMAMIIAFVMAALLLGPFNLISGKDFRPADLLNPWFIGGAVVIALFTGILAGTYPAFVLSSFNPVHTLKGALSMGTRGGIFRKITVVIQFTLSIFLITATMVIYLQLKHLQNQELGYDKENLLYLQLRGDMKKSYPVIKEELMRDPEVKAITASSDPPQSIGSNSDNASWEGKPKDMDILISMSGVDFDYVETMGIQMKSGRTFSREYADDMHHDSLVSFLINEQMEKVMGMENVVGAPLTFGAKGQVIGVMKDFNYLSLHSKIEPLAISMWGSNFWNYMYVRLNPGNLTASLKQLDKTWKRIMPMYPLEYHFVDQDFEKMYRVEVHMGTLMRYFAVLALLIACIGLFGLATYSVEQKTREVGIRKAHGAPPLSIFQIFTLEFIQLLFISAVISVPLAWFLLSRFLRNYSYHIGLSPWIFVVAIVTTLIVAMLAILYQTGRAIRTNPAVTLKHE
jgi:ABC-type antimicrobial peptide transport system permease subunit